MRRDILQQIEEQCQREDERFLRRIEKIQNLQVSLSGRGRRAGAPRKNQNKCTKNHSKLNRTFY